MGYILLVDHHGHTTLAVHALCAVDPDWGGVVDEDAESRGHPGGRASRCGLEARVEASDVGAVLSDGLAGLGEGRLGHGVVSASKLELYDVSDGSGNLLGGECLSAVCTDGDHDHFCAGLLSY